PADQPGPRHCLRHRGARHRATRLDDRRDSTRLRNGRTRQAQKGNARMTQTTTFHDRLATYRQIFAVGAQNTFVYRWNFLLRTIFGIVPLVGMVFIWRAVFAAKGGGINGYEYSSMIFYFMLVVFVDNLITPTEDEWQIAGEIRDGKI